MIGMIVSARRSLLLLLVRLCLQPGAGCIISGTDSGVCSKRYLPSSYGNVLNVQAIETDRSRWDCDGVDCLPFCGTYVASYPLCLPKSDDSVLLPHQNFPRFKDNWIEESALKTIANNPDRFAANLDCQEAYKRYMCYSNFPRCDDNELSLPICSSVCENFMRACGLDKDLRSFCEAGDHHAQPSASAAGVSSYGKELPVTTAFPGQPFVKNKWLPKSRGRGQPDLVCTPSVKNASAEKGGPMWWLAGLGLVIASSSVVAAFG